VLGSAIATLRSPMPHFASDVTIEDDGQRRMPALEHR
jgi:hypothetical protein